MVAFEEFARTTKTFRAVLDLARAGYGQQAQVLVRTIFESAMLIRWALRNPEQAETQVQLHALFSIELFVAAERAAGIRGSKPLVPRMTSEQRQDAIRLFGRRGSGYWSGHRELKALVDDEIAHLDDPGSIEQLRAFFSVVIAWANRMTHSTGLSVRGHRSEDPNDPDASDDTLVLITGPSRHQVFDALHGGAGAYFMALDAVVERLIPDAAVELRQAMGRLWRAWKDPLRLSNLSDDDDCPCDAQGTRWAECHRWTSAIADLNAERAVITAFEGDSA
jgi:hypothetical protein